MYCPYLKCNLSNKDSSLTQEFEKQVDPVVYNHFINGIENINKCIENKEIEIDYINSEIKLIETNPFELQHLVQLLNIGGG
ncbi:hypothetical protein CN514_14635 [Bacillus sp. AFS001701]|nr:hypothetical protein CN514_14635 [Bacillus sp. AFS001701]